MIYYMLISGIEGDTNAGFTGYEKSFRIDSFSFGAQNSGGAAQLSELTVALRMGKSMPTTLFRLGNATLITNVTILGLAPFAERLREGEKYRIEGVKITAHQ